MKSLNNSLIEIPMSTTNRDNGGYGYLLAQSYLERNTSNTIQYNSQIGGIGQISDQQIKNTGIDSHHKVDHFFSEDLEQVQNDLINAKKVKNSASNQNQSASIPATSNITSLNNLISPSNTILIKENDDIQNQTTEQKIQSEKNTGGISISKFILNKINSENINKTNSHFQEDKAIMHQTSSQTIKTSTFMDRLTHKTQKSKNNSQIVPSLFIYKGINKMTSIVNEKNLESNLTKMVKFVKLKKKIQEVRRFFLKSNFYKLFLSQHDSHFNRVLDDPSCSMVEDQPQKWPIINFLLSLRPIVFIIKIFKSIPTIEPSSKFKLIWDLIIGMVFMTYFFFIPVHVAINVSIHDLITQFVGYILHLFMFFDIMFSLNTGYFEKGVNISVKKKILIYYVKNYFWGDIISQIPLLISELGDQDSQVEKIFVLCFFVKLRNFQKIFRKFEDSFHLSPSTSNIISLIKLILTILFFSHIFACIWLFVGKFQDPKSQNWFKKIDIEDEDWIKQYIAAYYFSTVTMITVGYGDISPMNSLERLVSVGTMLISCVIFAYTINQIGTIFADLFSQDRQMKEFFYIINDYMDNRNINFSLQYKIREYLDYYWREQDQNKSELEKKIIDSLSEQLREKLMFEANRIVLKDTPIFNMNFNNQVILKMIPIIQTLHTTPNQVIFSEGQMDDDMFIYFVEKGKVEVCREINKNEDEKYSKGIITLGPGSCFGAWSFFTNMERREMVRSLEFSKLLMIKRSEFLELINDMPSELEKFQMMKDTIIFENNQQFLDVKCMVCQSYNHEIQHCHYFHFSPDKFAIIKKDIIKHLLQERDESFRRKQLLSFKNLFLTQEKSQDRKDWKEKNQETIEQYCQQYLQLQNYDDDDLFDETNTEQDDQYEDLYSDDENEIDEESEDEDETDNDEEKFTRERYKDRYKQYSQQEEDINDESSNASSEKQQNQKRISPVPIQEEEDQENDITQSHVRGNKRKHTDKLYSKLNLSVKQSQEFEDSCSSNSASQNNEDNILKNNLLKQIQTPKITETADQEESMSSNFVQFNSERGSQGKDSMRKIDRSNNLEKVFQYSQKYDQKFFNQDQINSKIQNRSQDKVSTFLSLQATPNNDTNQLINSIKNDQNDLYYRRIGNKQLTVVTNQVQENIINMSKTPATSDSLDKKLKTQNPSQIYTNELRLNLKSQEDEKQSQYSPQLMFFAADDAEKDVSDLQFQLLEPNEKFQFEGFFQIDEEIQDDLNMIPEIQIKETKQISSNANMLTINNELDIPKKMSKQKSVRIIETNEDRQVIKSRKVSNSQISISDISDAIKNQMKQKSFNKFEKKSQTFLNFELQPKRRKSSQRRKSEQFLYDNKKRINWDNQSPQRKKNDISIGKRRSRNSQGQLEIMNKINSLTSGLTDSHGLQSVHSSDKQRSHKKSLKGTENEILLMSSSLSPEMKLRQFQMQDYSRSQSFKNINLYAGKQNIQQQLQQQAHQFQQKNSMGFQVPPSQSSRESISQSIQLAFQQQQQLYGHSSLADITSYNSLNNNNNVISLSKIKNKTEKQNVQMQQQNFNQFQEQDHNDSNKNIINKIDVNLQRKDSSESVQSNVSSNVGANQNNYFQKKSTFSKHVNQQIPQSNIKRSSSPNPQNPKIIGMSPYNNQQNLQIHQLSQGAPLQYFQVEANQQSQNYQNQISSSPLYSPSKIYKPNFQGMSHKNLNRQKNPSNLTNKNSHNDSTNSLNNQKSKGDTSPKQSLSNKQILILQTMTNQGILDIPQDDQNFSQVTKKQNFIKLDDQNSRKYSTMSMNSVNTKNNNQNNINKNTYKQLSQTEGQLGLKKLGEIKQSSFSNRNLKGQPIGQYHQKQQLQFHQVIEKSPNHIHDPQQSTIINMHQSNAAQQYMFNQQSQLQQIGNQVQTSPLNNQQQTSQGFIQHYNETQSSSEYGYDEENNIFNIMNFEEMKLFQYYFPKGNYQRIIQKNNTMISKNFLKFLKSVKKFKAQQTQKRKFEEITNSANRRGSIIKKQLMKKKSLGPNEVANALKNNQGWSDEKIVTRSRGGSVGQPVNLDDSQISNDSDHKVSPNLASDNRISQFENNISSFPYLENRKISQSMTKSIFNKKKSNQ